MEMPICKRNPSSHKGTSVRDSAAQFRLGQPVYLQWPAAGEYLAGQL